MKLLPAFLLSHSRGAVHRSIREFVDLIQLIVGVARPRLIAKLDAPIRQKIQKNREGSVRLTRRLCTTDSTQCVAYHAGDAKKVFRFSIDNALIEGGKLPRDAIQRVPTRPISIPSRDFDLSLQYFDMARDI